MSEFIICEACGKILCAGDEYATWGDGVITCNKCSPPNGEIKMANLQVASEPVTKWEWEIECRSAQKECDRLRAHLAKTEAERDKAIAERDGAVGILSKALDAILAHPWAIDTDPVELERDKLIDEIGKALEAMGEERG